MDDFDKLLSLDDLDDVDENDRYEYDVLPAGEYLVEIMNVEGKEGMNDKGEYFCVTLTFEVKDAEHSGAKIWHRLYTTHSSVGFMARQKAELKRIYIATKSKAASDLIGKLLIVKTRIEEYGDKKNPRIVDHWSADSSAAVKAATKSDDDNIPF